jgi:hypothetical protein
MTQPLRVSLPLGIGDCHWACQKLRALGELEGRPVHAYVNESPSHASVGFLELVPFIQKAICSPLSVYDVWNEMPPNHRDPRWSDRATARNWGSFDYVVVANGHLERGERIETFFPDVGTDYTYDLNIKDEDRQYVRNRWGVDRTLLYLSGAGPNWGFHRNWWKPEHWVEVVSMINGQGEIPLLVGANTFDDCRYFEIVEEKLKAAGVKYDSAISFTTIPQYCALIQDASAWVGLNSGGGIVSAMQHTPTIMFWSDSNYPGVSDPGNKTVPLHTNMRTSWLNDAQLKTYRTLSYGDPDFTPRRVVELLREIAR